MRKREIAPPCSLLLRQRPDAAPIRTRGGDVEVCDAFQEQFARRIAQINGKAGLETGARLLPSLAPLGIERLHIGFT